MTNRVRYRKLSDSVVESVRTFKHPSNGAEYKVRINTTDNQWLVLDAETELTAASGFNTNYSKLKLEAREALAALGVLLTKESRKTQPATA